MSLSDAFARMMRNRDLKAAVREAARDIAKAIENGKPDEAVLLLDGLNEDVLKNLIAREREGDHALELTGKALSKGDNKSFMQLVTKCGTWNGSLQSTQYVSDGVTDTTYKSFLYYAIQQKNIAVAEFLLSNPSIDIEKGGSRYRNNGLQWRESPIQAARAAGLIGITIQLAESLALKRREEGRVLFEEKICDAEGYENEAKELKKLNLVDGRYQLPQHYAPNPHR